MSFFAWLPLLLAERQPADQGVVLGAIAVVAWVQRLIVAGYGYSMPLAVAAMRVVFVRLQSGFEATPACRGKE